MPLGQRYKRLTVGGAADPVADAGAGPSAVGVRAAPLRHNVIDLRLGRDGLGRLEVADDPIGVVHVRLAARVCAQGLKAHKAQASSAAGFARLHVWVEMKSSGTLLLPHHSTKACTLVHPPPHPAMAGPPTCSFGLTFFSARAAWA